MELLNLHTGTRSVLRDLDESLCELCMSVLAKAEMVMGLPQNIPEHPGFSVHTTRHDGYFSFAVSKALPGGMSEPLLDAGLPFRADASTRCWQSLLQGFNPVKKMVNARPDSIAPDGYPWAAYYVMPGDLLRPGICDWVYEFADAYALCLFENLDIRGTNR